MRRSNGKTRPGALIVVALAVAALGWLLLRASAPRPLVDSSTSEKEAAERSPIPTPKAHPTAGAGPSDSPASRPPGAGPQATMFPALEPKASPRPRIVYASRLSGRPGYYPPDDPESLSVLIGRREAPPVDLELSGGASSLEELGRVLLAALGSKDEGALDALRVTKHEFRVICWPEFPESRPITHITVDDAWMMAAVKSHAGAVRTIGLYGGRDLELVGLESAPPFAYRNFTRHSGVVLIARDRNGGDVLRLAFAPSVIERHGRFKALLYRDR